MLSELIDSDKYEIVLNTTGKTFTEDTMMSLCEDIDGLIVGIDPVTATVIEHAKKLKVISKYGAGLDNIDLPVAAKHGIKVEKADGANSVSVAELAISLVFALSRHLPQNISQVKEGKWDRIQGNELSCKTIGIIGLGCIGQEVARMAKGIGMSVVAHDPYCRNTDFLMKNSIQLLELEKLLKVSDFVSLHVPLTRETNGMIKSTYFNLMKKTACLINTSRGELVNEEDLYCALTENRIAGAAQDVFSKEPPGAHRLLKLENFLLTPHIGSFTEEAISRTVTRSIRNLLKHI